MNVLAIGAHPDDIELGCGGSLLRHVAAGDKVTMLVLSAGEHGLLDTDRVGEQEAAAAVIGADLLWGGLPDCGITNNKATVDLIEAAVKETQADLVYTHSPRDTHQDHVATAAASMSAGRRVSRFLCYQSPSTTDFEANVFVDVESTIEGKLESLRCHMSQVLRCLLVDLEAITATSRYWGAQARIRYAEAFHAPRFVWDIGSSAVAKRHLAVVDGGLSIEMAVG